MCDAAGNLLFYSDGDTIYNSLGNIMNTTNYGCNSSTQAALIIPFPGSSSKYYLFNSVQEAFPHGISYSIIDMTLNGGLGGVIGANTQLVHPACEKLTAVKNSNGTGYWVICHAYPSNEYYVYPVTASGVGTPIITPIGLPIISTTNTQGFLKSSPDGQKLIAVRLNGANDPNELFDFDPATGIISNCIQIPNTGSPYGTSFSPDNSKLYISILSKKPKKILAISQ